MCVDFEYKCIDVIDARKRAMLPTWITTAA